MPDGATIAGQALIRDQRRGRNRSSRQIHRSLLRKLPTYFLVGGFLLMWLCQQQQQHPPGKTRYSSSIDLSATLRGALNDLTTSLASDVLDYHSLLIDQCGILWQREEIDKDTEEPKGEAKIFEKWGICRSRSLNAGKKEQEPCPDDQGDYGLGDIRHTLIDVLTERVQEFCASLDDRWDRLFHSTDSARDANDGDGGGSGGWSWGGPWGDEKAEEEFFSSHKSFSSHHNMTQLERPYLADLRGGSNPCKNLSKMLMDEAEAVGEGGDWQGLPLNLAWRYYKLGNQLAQQEPSGLNALTIDLEETLADLELDLLRWPDDNDFLSLHHHQDPREQYMEQINSWRGPNSPVQANNLAKLLLTYFAHGPDIDYHNNTDNMSLHRHRLTDTERRYGVFDFWDKPEGQGMLLWRVGNMRRSIGEFCSDLETELLTPLGAQFVPWANGVLDALHLAAAASHRRRGNNNESRSAGGKNYLLRTSFLVQREEDLQVVAALAGLPWREHCDRALQRLDALERDLGEVGRILRLAMDHGWVLVVRQEEEKTNKTRKQGFGSGEVVDDKDDDVQQLTLRRVLLPPRRYIAGYVSGARASLKRLLWVTGKTGLGGWRGETAVDKRDDPRRRTRGAQ